MSVDRLIPEGGGVRDGTTLVTFRITNLEPQGFGVDAAIGVWPEGFRYAALGIGVDVGPAYSVALPNTTFLLKAGPSVIAIVGTGGATGAIGGYVGGGIIRRLTPGFGVRFDAAEHFYSVNGADGGGTRALTLGFGVTSIPRPR
ncbi:MAG: hypothetical protein M3081_03630 [Gemmatimonadota bacterium]|nr:hypothetical protein [Gemmatimonadota bacterium]